MTVNCPICRKPIRDWRPYRVSGEVHVCFRCEACEVGFQLPTDCSIRPPAATRDPVDYSEV
jgi:transposase-like protein